MKRTRGSRRSWQLAANLLACAAGFVLAGCGDDPVEPQHVDLEAAVGAGEAASGLSQLVASEALVDAAEAPFTSATGEVEGLGEFGVGNHDLGSLSGAAVIVAGAVEALKLGADLASGAGIARQAIAAKAAAGPGTAACEVLGANEKCATRIVCVNPTVDPNVNLVTIHNDVCVGTVARTEQRFHVDNAGTVGTDDDQVRSFWSLVVLDDGTEYETSIMPQVGEFLVDGAIADVNEIIRPATGLVASQTNTITLNIGLLNVQEDETLLSLASVVLFRNGASGSVTVTDDDAEGITNEDVLDVTMVLTPALTDRRLHSVTAVVVVLVHVLDDPNDDEIAELSRTVVFDGVTATGGQPTATTVFVPAAPVRIGAEPCGGTFSKHAVLPASWEVRTVDLVVDRTCGGSGSYDLEVQFADATSHTRAITWSGTGQATLAETGRDGTVVTGTFDETAHTFSIDTTFPAGNDPVSAHQEGSSSPETGARAYTRVVTYLDEHQDVLAVTAQRQEDGSRTLTGYTIDRRGRVDFELEWSAASSTLTGAAAGPDDETASFTLVRQEDGTALLVFEWEDPSADVHVAGEATVNADGSGCGQIRITQGGASVTVPFCFAADGSGVLGDAAPVPF